MGEFDWVRQIRVVLFDWGGTLCTTTQERGAIMRGVERITARFGASDQDKRAAAASLASMLQRAYSRADTDPEHRELDLALVLEDWAEQMGLAARGEWNVNELTSELWHHWQGCLVLLDDPVFVLRELQARGYRLGLLSNVAAPGAFCRAELRRLGLLDFFEACVFSSEVGLRKPHPEIFRRMLQAIGQIDRVEPAQVIYVGDSPRWDVGGAKRAGLRVVLFRSQAATWPEQEYQEYRPDAQIDRLDELLVLLPRQAPQDSGG